MTEVEHEKREKVIKELEYCVSLTSNGPKCANCDYADEFHNGDCETYLLSDALALLKAQEPRVMTLEEVKAAAGHDVWLELSGNIADDVLFAATIEGCGTKGLCTRYESLNYSAYGIRPYGWRCWTSRPDHAIREVVKWDG